jgi:glycosyltransferase involved in cell wall biosynthesis
MNKENKHQPLVSIIMNCYNGEAYLKESIESVISQNYKNWELIFWDNKSKDKSQKIFKSYKDERLKYFLAKEHTSLYSARNEAIKKCSGEFISFLDTDDVWYKNKLELQIPLFEDQEVAVVYGNHFIFNQKLNKKKIFLKGKKPKGFILEDLLKNYCTSLVTLVVRKYFLDKYQPPFNNKFNIIGDFDLMIEMSTKYKFDCVEVPIAFYRIHEKNESFINKKTHIEELKIWEKNMINHPKVSQSKNFVNIKNMINNLEVANFILNKDFENAKLKIKKMPFSIKKIKYLVSLFLPYNFVKKFI